MAWSDRSDHISPEELKEVMGVNPKWSYRAELDGWVKAHEAVRADLADLLSALTAWKNRIEKGQAAAQWEVSNLKEYFSIFEHNVHHHHDSEEKILFPFMETRVKLPPKMSADHKTLLAMMDNCRDQINNFQVTGAANKDLQAVSKLLEDFTAFKVCMEEHLHEEEVEGLPLLRKHFSSKEVEPSEKKILETLTLRDMGWILRPMTEQQRKEWLSEVVKAPGLIQWLLLIPQAEKYQKTVQYRVNEVRTGERQPQKSFLGCM